jgi:hypothetical protein
MEELKRLSLSNFDVLHFSLHSAIDRDFPPFRLVLTSHSTDQKTICCRPARSWAQTEAELVNRPA